MKRILAAAALVLLSFSLNAQDVFSGYVSYSLPRTDLVFEVTARQEVFHAGPYARFAQKYLGVQARLKDETSFEITEINLTSAVEADQSTRYTAAVSGSALQTYLQITSQGLVSGEDNAYSGNASWRFPLSAKGTFEGKGIPANLTSESNTLQGAQGSFSQNVTVEKSSERKAQEVADMIFKIRENRYKILVGDTDATYSGEAMKATMDELNKLEEDYTTLFLGYSEYNDQKAVFEVIPKADNAKQMYVAFRVSDTDGLVSSDNMSGKPYYLKLDLEPIAQAVSPKGAPKPKYDIYYRIPAICKATLSDGVNSLLQLRVPVYQLGITSLYPIYK